MNVRQKLDALERDATSDTDDRHRMHRIMGRILSSPEAAELANEMARRRYFPGDPVPPWCEAWVVALSDDELHARLSEYVREPAEVTA